MLTNKENTIDALLITHEHNDHIIGLDDLDLLFSTENKMFLSIVYEE
jgi:phosphoribosyl 1,2-cyclic phosphate phosphodiesterase